jgi:hypothetical protein
MKKRTLIPILATAGALILLTGLAACSGLFTDPLKDKDTGDPVTVLLLDRNFIKTKINIRLVDKVLQEAIADESIDVRFSGDDASHLVTFGGYLQSTFTTSSGLVEVGVDPNMPLDGAHPLELTVIAVSPHYISVPQFVSYTAEGIKNLTTCHSMGSRTRPT